MEQVKNNVGFIILAIAAIAIIAVVWFRAEPAAAPSGGDMNTSTSLERETELPDFARVEQRDGQRVLVNERDGYELVLEDDWVPEYYTNVVEIFVRDDYPSGEMTASFSILRNPQNNLSLEKWTKRWLKFADEDCPNCFENQGIIRVNDLDVVKLFDRAGLGGNRYNYIFIKDNNFYSLSIANFQEDKVIQIIKQI